MLPAPLPPTKALLPDLPDEVRRDENSYVRPKVILPRRRRITKDLSASPPNEVKSQGDKELPLPSVEIKSRIPDKVFLSPNTPLPHDNENWDDDLSMGWWNKFHYLCFFLALGHSPDFFYWAASGIILVTGTLI